MTDGPNETTATDTGVEVTTGTEQTEQQSSNNGSNPAWADIESQVDPFTFSKLRPVLSKMDQQAQQRVTQSNEQLKPYKEFIDQKVPVETLRSALALGQRLNDNPVEVYEQLGSFLRENGRMPTQQEQAAADPVTGEIPNADEQEDPRFAALEAQQQQMQQYLAEQQYQQELHSANVALDSETNALKGAHPELSDADVQEIIGRAAFVAQQNNNGQIPSLEETYGWFSGLRNRILSAPRPGDSAPRLLPTNGGLPSGQQQQSLGQMSSSDIQALIAGSLEQDRQAGRF